MQYYGYSALADAQLMYIRSSPSQKGLGMKLYNATVCPPVNYYPRNLKFMGRSALGYAESIIEMR